MDQINTYYFVLTWHPHSCLIEVGKVLWCGSHYIKTLITQTETLFFLYFDVTVCVFWTPEGSKHSKFVMAFFSLLSMSNDVCKQALYKNQLVQDLRPCVYTIYQCLSSSKYCTKVNVWTVAQHLCAVHSQIMLL